MNRIVWWEISMHADHLEMTGADLTDLRLREHSSKDLADISLHLITQSIHPADYILIFK